MQIAFFFCISPVTYIASSIMILYIPSWVENRAGIIIGAWCSALSYLLIGPSTLFGFSDSVILSGFGMAVLGLWNPIGIVLGLPEM
jgi:hypothetical protein